MSGCGKLSPYTLILTKVVNTGSSGQRSIKGTAKENLERNLRLDRIYSCKDEPFTLIEADNIITQLSVALHYAHAHMVHRDIKPENILVETDEDEDKDEVQKDLTNIKTRLTDFGIAKMLSPGVFTTASIQMGTPYYMAPEQKTDAATVDKRADIYAAGVVLFELLTLENTIGLKLPTELNNELPKEIDNIIKKALEPSPRDRYEDINNLSDDVGRIVAVEEERIKEEKNEEEKLKRREAYEEQKQRKERERQQREQREKIYQEMAKDLRRTQLLLKKKRERGS
jgi:serine/threonine-protein kinase